MDGGIFIAWCWRFWYKKLAFVLIAMFSTMGIALPQSPGGNCQDPSLDEGITNLPTLLDPILPLGLNAPPNVIGPHNFKINYKRTYEFSRAFPLGAQYNLEDVYSVKTFTEYYDGLGRPIMEVTKKGGPYGRDLVQPIVYDRYERQPKKFLPYAAMPEWGNAIQGESSNKFYPNFLREQYDFYHQAPDVAHTDFPFAEVTFEPSSLSRVQTETAPGEPWVNNNKKMRYEDWAYMQTYGKPEIRWWYIGDGLDNTITSSTPYSNSTLWVKAVTDEDANEAFEFTDKAGRLAATMNLSQDPSGSLDDYIITSYVYDRYGNLRMVIPPLAYKQLQDNNWAMTPAIEQLVFIYNYDERRRLIIKRTPDAGEAHMIYDPLDRLIMTQDANQRTAVCASPPSGGDRSISGSGEDPDMPPQPCYRPWTAFKYDRYNRQVFSAIIYTYGSREGLQQLVNQSTAARYETPTASAAYEYYSNVALPVFNSSTEILTVNYYDNYDIDQDGVQDPTFTFVMPPTGTFNTPVTAFNRVEGKLTVTKVKDLTEGNFLSSAIFYDSKSRVVQTRSTNHKGGEDIATSQYDFVGNVMKTHLAHTVGSGTLILAERFTYDHLGRLNLIRQKIDNKPEQVIASHFYNDIGQLSRKIQGGAFQEIAYSYNTRGWITKISSELFTEELYYTDYFEIPRFNGNIAGVVWENGRRYGQQRAYGYRYDRLNRLIKADYRHKEARTEWSREIEDYTVFGLNYDLNGNLLSAVRFGLIADSPHLTQRQFGLIDRMKYIYQPAVTGNRLIAVDDLIDDQNETDDFEDNDIKFCDTEQAEFLYDANGNVTADANKGITEVEYNYLNLPRKITFASGDFIENNYTATGAKLSQKVYSGQTGQPLAETDYMGRFIYEPNQQLSITNAEGVARYNSNPHADTDGWHYEWHLRDHLGNLRTSYHRHLDSLTVGEEPQHQAEETSNFDYVDETRQLDSLNAHTGSNSSRLNADENREQGPTRIATVMPHDSIAIEVFGRYHQQQLRMANAWLKGLSVLAVGALFSRTMIKGEAFTPAGAAAPFTIGLLGLGLPLLFSREAGSPEGFLQYTLYDADSNLVDIQRVELTQDAEGNWEKLELGLTVAQPGHIKIELVNLSGQNVFFDDLKVYHYSNRVVQEDHYYPFGMRLGGMGPKGDPEHNWKFNGKEKQDALGLQWYDFHARQYDPQLGRFHGVDPMAGARSWVSPYNFVQNNPISRVDPTGMLDGDYLNKNGERIGTDGQTDGKAYLVMNNTEAGAIYATDQAGGVTALSEVSSAIELPSYGVRQEIGRIAGQDKGSPFQEFGGAFGTTANGSERVVEAMPGAKVDPLKQSHVGINPLLPRNPADAGLLTTINGTFHTHPSGEKYPMNMPGEGRIGGSTAGKGFEQPMSGTDKTNAGNRAAQGLVQGNSYIISQGNGPGGGQVHIYNGNGVLGSMPKGAFFNYQAK